MIRTKIKMQLKLYRHFYLILWKRASYSIWGEINRALAFGKNAKPTVKKYGARGKRVYSSNKEEKMRKFCLMQGVLTSATHAFFCHGNCHVKQCDLT